MSDLREAVSILTGTSTLHGHLYVGADGLPELWIPSRQLGPNVASVTYRPATFPAAWRLLRVSPYQDVLYDAWVWLTTLREVIADAQREAEQETPEPEDDLTAAKRQRALEEEHGA